MRLLRMSKNDRDDGETCRGQSWTLYRPHAKISKVEYLEVRCDWSK